MSPVEENRIDVFLKTMDIVRAIESENAAVADILNDNEKKAKMRQKLVAAYVEMGREPNPKAIDEAIESVLSHQYEFKPAQKSFSTTLAHAYINRGTLIRQWFVTPILALTLAGATLGTVNSINNSIEAGKERDVEERVVRVFSSEQQLEARVNDLANDEVAKQLPAKEKTTFNQSIAQGRDSLKETKSFFDKYCPQGKAEKVVTRDNYAKVSDALPAVESTLGTVQSQILSASDVLQGQRKIITAKQSLDKAFQDFRGSGAPTVLLNRAQVLYNQGLASLEQRDVNGARSAEGNISALARDVAEITTLPKAIEQLHKSAKEIAVEKKAVELESTIYADSKVALETGDIQRLRTDKDKLSELVDDLSHRYEVIIASRPKSYVRRDYTANATGIKTVSGYYVIVEARENGTAIPRRVADAEDNGRIKTVTQWGEEVPLYVFEEIKADKKDGTVDNNKFALKEKGYLTEETIFTSQDGRKLKHRGKKITQW